MKKILKSCFVLIISLCCVTLLSGCSIQIGNDKVNTNETNEKGESNSKGKLSDKIKTSTGMTKKNNLVAIVTNGNNLTVDLEVEVEFYDANGVICGSDKQSFTGVVANGEVAAYFYDTPSSFESYKIFVDIEETDDFYETHVKEITVTTNQTEDGLVVQATNNSDKKIDSLEYAVVFYKDGEIVGYDYEFEININPGRSANTTFRNPYDSNYDDIEYDNFKIFVNEAYSYQ